IPKTLVRESLLAPTPAGILSGERQAREDDRARQQRSIKLAARADDRDNAKGRKRERSRRAVFALWLFRGFALKRFSARRVLFLPLPAILAITNHLSAATPTLRLEAPDRSKRFDSVEFVIHVSDPPFENPFTDAELTGTFRTQGKPDLVVHGFADAPDGSIF